MMPYRYNDDENRDPGYHFRNAPQMVGGVIGGGSVTRFTLYTRADCQNAII